MLTLPGVVSSSDSIYALIAETVNACNFKTLMPRNCQLKQGYCSQRFFLLSKSEITKINYIMQPASANLFNESVPFINREEETKERQVVNPIVKCQMHIAGSVVELNKLFAELKDLDSIGRTSICFGYIKTAVYLLCMAAAVFGALKLGGWKAIAVGAGATVGFFSLNLLGNYLHNKDLAEKDRRNCKWLLASALVKLVANPVFFIFYPTRDFNLKCRTVASINQQHTALVTNFKAMVSYFENNHNQLRQAINTKIAEHSYENLQTALTDLNSMCQKLGIKT